jgi:hypothetical protein
MLIRDKRSSLLQKFVTYGHKKFYNVGPWMHNFKESSGACTIKRFTAVIYGFL